MNHDAASGDLPATQAHDAPASLILLAAGLTAAVGEACRSLEIAKTAEDIAAVRATMQTIAKALVFVGEQPLSTFVEAIEQVLDGEGKEGMLDRRAHAGITACKSLLHYLEALSDDPASSVLRLFGTYKMLLAEKGREKIHPADLIFPSEIDESEVRFAASGETGSASSEVDLAACRTGFENHLLHYLRATDAQGDAQLLQRMAEIVGSVINTPAVSAHKNFWRVICEVVTLFANGDVEMDQYAKKFLGQVNLQLRRLVSGTCEGDARLLREGLFFIALAPASHVAATLIRQANALPGLQQTDYQPSCDPAADPAHAAKSSHDPRETALTELATALARVEASIEDSFNDDRSRAEVAKAICEFAATADRFQFGEPAAALKADALQIEKMVDTGEAVSLQSPAVKSAVYTLAALSLSLPLMRHAGVMPYRSRQDDPAAGESEVLVPVVQAEPVEQPLPDAAENMAPEEPAEEDLDLELLDIFLTEADDILHTLEQALHASRHEPADMAHVTVLRRGFHTIKGSCRMVGLNAMSDGARAVENFLNDWLAEPSPGAEAHYVLLDYAKKEIEEWVGEIRERGKSRRRPDGMIAAVETARRSTRLGINDDADEAGPAIAGADAAQSLRIGDIDVSAPLHRIYSVESAALLATIGAHLEQWQRALPDTIAPEMLRATHSLKSSSASVGFTALHTLAQGLDDVMQSLEHSTEALNADHCIQLSHLVQQLQIMQQAFAACRMPSTRDDLRQQLLTLLADLQTRSDAPSHVEATQKQGEPIEASPPEEDDAAICPDVIDPELLQIFLEEGQDLLPQIGESLYKLQRSPDDSDLIRYVLRPLHTIKGSARMAGAMRLGQHMHELESCIDEIVRNGVPSAAQVDDLLARYDRGLQLFEALQAPPPSQLAPAEQPVAETKPQALAASADFGGVSEIDIGKAVNAAPLVRIRAGILDNLLNQAGEISISRSGLESEVNVLRQHLADLGGNVARLTAQLREVEIQAEIQIAASNQRQPNDQHFDPLEFDRFTHLQEMTRMLAESVNDVASLQKNLLETVDHTQNSLAQQARLTREMQQEVMQARMVQFRGVEERLQRLVRQMAKETGKELELEIHGGGVELDRSILEKMVGPFEHLLRNAAAHGIESIEQRRKAGKPAVGKLSLEVRQEGYEVMIRLADDGQGLDLARIHEKAIRLGLIDAEQQFSDSELTGVIFQPGFTTSTDVTAIAGRGVGMDVVRSEIASLGGRISIDTVAGEGATFIIHLPLSLAVTQVVLLELGGQTYGIPSLLVEQVLQLKAAAQADVFREGSLDWQGHKLPMHYLPVLLGEDRGIPAQQTLSILVVKSGHDFLAILVDRIVGNREVVTKNIGPQLAHMVGVVGATVLGSGSIALILNPIQLAQRHGYQKILRQVEPAAVDKDSGRKTILVVDDSLTVRRVMQRLLTREGYHVVLATDGVDALHQLQGMRPDIALIDIEMPRMDGFDLTRNIRDMRSTATLPIIMITSRTASKHRERAMELGVNEYLGKPYQDDVLLKMIRHLIDEEGEPSASRVDEVLFTPAPDDADGADDAAAPPQADGPGT